MRQSTRLSLIAMSLAITSLASPGAPIARAEDESHRSHIDRLAAPYIDNEIVVGMTVGIIHDGQTHVFGYGRVSKESAQPPNGDTIYEIGGITNVFTGILLADAVVDGRLKLEQPAGDLLPADVRMPQRGADGVVTLRHLATHTSGLPRLPGNLAPADPANPYADYTVEQLHAFLNRHTLERSPGVRNEYSNLGQGLLGHLLALESETTYEKLVTSRITAPLSMSSTGITLDDDEKTRLAPPYDDDGDLTTHWVMPTLAGAGALRSTANDMLRFAEACMAPPNGELGEAINLAWDVHQEPIDRRDFATGLGWQVARDGSTRWHNGGTGGYRSMILVNRDMKTAVVVLANTDTNEVDHLAQDVFRMLGGANVEPRLFERRREKSLKFGSFTDIAAIGVAATVLAAIYLAPMLFSRRDPRLDSASNKSHRRD